MEGGEESSIHKIAAVVTSEKAGGDVENFDVGASSQYESKAEGTVIRTEASLLGLLVRDLTENTEPSVEIEKVNLEKPNSLAQIEEGELVSFTTHALAGPGYIRPYVVMRDTATLQGLFPRELGNKVSARRAANHRHQGELFAHQIGPDPRITFLVSPGQEGENIPTILMPMRYSALTTERSLLEKDSEKHTGGLVTVFGKVIRKFTTEPSNCKATEAPCPNYTDFATREVWERPLDHASRYLIKRVSHNCRLEAVEEQKLKGNDTERISGRKCLLQKLENQTELFAPSAVIAPIAILK
jgi:hypothetical protein